MNVQVDFDYKNGTTLLRYPRKEFCDGNGVAAVEKLQRIGVHITKQNSRYVYVELPFNLMNGEWRKNEAEEVESKKQEYEPYVIPDQWDVELVEEDMNKIINCASCGRKMTFGEGYTSRLIHSPHGLGYCVCEECHVEEVLNEREEN